MTSQELRKLFLREFTMELVRNVNLIPRVKQAPQAIIQSPIQAEQPKRIIFAPRVAEVRELEQKEKTAEEKINALLASPEIKSIECPGAGKNLIISKKGRNEPIGLVLSGREIKDYLQKISQKTKVPFGESGLFRAEVGNLIVTAIISEFIGTRFVVTKK
jgi:hypothetical protein